MTCNHTYDESGTCFECGRPQNAIHAAQEWMNDFDEANKWMEQDKLTEDARDIIEWLLEDLDPANKLR